MLSLLYIDMNWSGNFREGLAREIRENKTLAKITAYTVIKVLLWLIAALMKQDVVSFQPVSFIILIPFGQLNSEIKINVNHGRKYAEIYIYGGGGGVCAPFIEQYCTPPPPPPDKRNCSQIHTSEMNIDD